jgi:hypothetical protein
MKTYNNIPQSLVEAAYKVMSGQEDILEDLDLYEEIIEDADDLDEEFEDWYAEEIGIVLAENDAERARKKEMKNAFRAGRKSMDMQYGRRTTDDGSDTLPKFTKDKTTDRLFKLGKKDNESGFGNRFATDPLETGHSDKNTAGKIKANKQAMAGNRIASRVSGKEVKVDFKGVQKGGMTKPLPSGEDRVTISTDKNNLTRAREIAKAFNKAQPAGKRVKVQYFDRKDGMKIYITGDPSAVKMLKTKMPA